MKMQTASVELCCMHSLFKLKKIYRALCGMLFFLLHWHRYDENHVWHDPIHTSHNIDKLLSARVNTNSSFRRSTEPLSAAARLPCTRRKQAATVEWATRITKDVRTHYSDWCSTFITFIHMIRDCKWNAAPTTNE